jgi:hypothetical protein
MKNSKFEFQYSKDLSRAARAILSANSFSLYPRDSHLIIFEFRISNFEFFLP